MKKQLSSKFISYLEDQAGIFSGNPKAGYIWGTYGQTLTENLLKRYAATQSSYSTSEYVKLGSKWLGRRVFDCNGLAEGFIIDNSTGILTATSVNTTAQNNYSTWCKGSNSSNMDELPDVPGVAVFRYSSSAKKITHVGYLWKKDENGKWLVIESKGVNYGVVVTDLKDGRWTHWGYMNKYIEYDLNPYGAKIPDIAKSQNEIKNNVETNTSTIISEYPLPTLSTSTKSSYNTKIFVRIAQNLLNAKLNLNLTVDGLYGSNTKNAASKFQKSVGLTADGIIGPNTWEKLTR